MNRKIAILLLLQAWSLGCSPHDSQDAATDLENNESDSASLSGLDAETESTASPTAEQLPEPSRFFTAAEVDSGETIDRFLADGMDVNLRDAESKTPLHRAAMAGNHDAIETLIAAGADLDAVDMLDATPLHMAVEASDAKSALVLLDAGAQANPEDTYGNTPMDYARLAENAEMIALLEAFGGVALGMSADEAIDVNEL